MDNEPELIHSADSVIGRLARLERAFAVSLRRDIDQRRRDLANVPSTEVSRIEMKETIDLLERELRSVEALVATEDHLVEQGL